MTSRHPIRREKSAAVSLREGVLQLLSEATDFKENADDKSVHSARKRAKCIRAALRLQRAALGEALYRAANREVRDSARPLSRVRDAALLVESLGQLRRNSRAQGDRSHADQLQRLLSAELSSSRRQLTGNTIRRSALKLGKISRRLSIARRKATDMESARLGMKNIYRKGRRAYADAGRQRSNETLHEWRKQAKYLSNEAALMHKWFGRRLRKIRRRSQRISTLLGEDHDLAVVMAKLDRWHAGGVLTNETAGDALNEKIVRRREKLQSESFELGKRLYRRSPGKFIVAIRKSFKNDFAKGSL